MSTQFNCQKHFFLKLFCLVKQLIQQIQFRISMDFVYTQLNINIVLFQTIPFNVSTVLEFEGQSKLVMSRIDLSESYLVVPKYFLNFA